MISIAKLLLGLLCGQNHQEFLKHIFNSYLWAVQKFKLYALYISQDMVASTLQGTYNNL